MNFKDSNKPVVNPVDDANLDAALRHFRAHARDWSEREFAKPRVVRRSAWDRFFSTLARPAMVGSLTAAMLLASLGIPATVHFQHQAEAQRQAQIRHDIQKAAEEAALRKAADSVDDETLLSGIDSDIAQATPDAMQPLASLMSEDSTTARPAK